MNCIRFINEYVVRYVRMKQDKKETEREKEIKKNLGGNKQSFRFNKNGSS